MSVDVAGRSPASAPTRRPPARQRTTPTRAVIPTVVSAVVALAVWEAVATFWLGPLGIIASPTEIVGSLVATPDLYARGVGATAWVAIRGWLWGNAAAIVLAVLFVRFAVIENLLLRTALTLFCLPYVAIMPILAVTFEPDTARVALASIAVFFTTLVNTILGLRSAESGPLTMMRAWGGGATSALLYVRARAALPYVFTGLQVGAASAVLGAIFGEFLGAGSGLGVILINALATLDVARIWAVAVLATLIGAVPFAILGWVGRRLSPWSSSLAPAAASGTGNRRGVVRTVVVGALWAIASLVVTLMVWYGFLWVFDVSAYVGKTPWDVVEYLFVSANADAARAVLFEQLGITLLHAGVGYVIGLTIGIAVAVLFVFGPWAARTFGPFAIALQSVPIIVLTPILIVVFGRGLGGVAAITTIVTFFPTLTAVHNALQRTPRDALLLMRSYSGSRLSTLWRVQLPFAMPAIFSSARIAAPSSILAATVAEWLATGDGIGNVIITAQTQAQFTQLWAAAVLLTLVSLLFYALVSAAERRVLGRFSPTMGG